jgi:glycosyltransferase involved in cell wall biosynthesis
LIDFTQIPITRTGVGVYAENLVRELVAAVQPSDHLVLLLQKDELELRALTMVKVNVSVLVLPSRLFRNRGALLAFEQFIMPLLLLKHNIDVVHSLHYTHPLVSPCPRVVTIHDLTFFKFPQLHTLGRRLIMPFFIRRAMKHAEALIFVSAATRRDAELLMPGGRNMRKVVPLGVDIEDVAAQPQEVTASLREKSISQPFLLFLGTIEPRKNLARLIQAFERIAPDFPEHTLVLAGRLGWDYEPVLQAIEASPVRQRIRHLGYISELDKRALLAGCAALIYPSLYEGFGLPVLEAMAAGAPVVTSNISSLPEVAGTAALLVNPESVEELASAIRRLLGNPELVSQCRARGLERVKIFSWRRAAAETYEVYQQASQLQTKKRPKRLPNDAMKKTRTSVD